MGSACRQKIPTRAAKLKEPVELLKGWDCVSSVDSVAMTLFAEAYDRAMKMIAKRDVLNYPRIRALEATLAEPGENARAPGKSPGARSIVCSGSTARRSTCRAMVRFATMQPSLPIAGAPGPLGVVFNFYTLPQAGPEAPLRGRRAFVCRRRRAGGTAEGEDDSPIRRIGRSEFPALV